ncbi:MAG: hypothetical protein ABIH92_05095 [Nanoarchaeota archaeon]
MSGSREHTSSSKPVVGYIREQLENDGFQLRREGGRECMVKEGGRTREVYEYRTYAVKKYGETGKLWVFAGIFPNGRNLDRT